MSPIYKSVSMPRTLTCEQQNVGVFLWVKHKKALVTEFCKDRGIFTKIFGKVSLYVIETVWKPHIVYKLIERWCDVQKDTQCDYQTQCMIDLSDFWYTKVDYVFLWMWKIRAIMVSAATS